MYTLLASIKLHLYHITTVTVVQLIIATVGTCRPAFNITNKTSVNQVDVHH